MVRAKITGCFKTYFVCIKNFIQLCQYVKEKMYLNLNVYVAVADTFISKLMLDSQLK